MTVTRFGWLRTSPQRAPLAAWTGEPGEENAPVIAEKSSDLSEMPCSCTERPVGEFPAAIAMQEGKWLYTADNLRNRSALAFDTVYSIVVSSHSSAARARE